jgi:hypothetical protein
MASSIQERSILGYFDDELVELCSYVRQTSPVRELLANGIPLSTSIEGLH